MSVGWEHADDLWKDPVAAPQIRVGKGGIELRELTQTQRQALVQNTPLWFYILREAEFDAGRLKGVGPRIVAETLHRAMEGSQFSIVNDTSFHPTLGPDNATFRMVDLLLFAFEQERACWLRSDSGGGIGSARSGPIESLQHRSPAISIHAAARRRTGRRPGSRWARGRQAFVAAGPWSVVRHVAAPVPVDLVEHRIEGIQVGVVRPLELVVARPVLDHLRP